MIDRLPALLIAATVVIFFSAPLTIAEQPEGDPIEFFESKVRPLLVERCYECHSSEAGESSGGLLLDTAAATLKGGAHGAAIKPGEPQSSLIMQAVGYEDPELQMPPDGKLDSEAIEVLRRWIQIGAPDPRAGEVAKSSSPLDRDPSSHWAFVPPVKPRLPLPADSDALDPIDTLADHSARSHDLHASPTADREVLIRRLYFDLTGLPPSLDDIHWFVASDRPEAYVRLVDQLLAAPDFGERFGRHWMDVSRYANTVGYALGGQSREYEGSERYRDWAVKAFATDMPYDEMLRHQLAGDRTDPDNANGNLDAMGFLTLGRRFLSNFDTLDDRIDVITRGLLGMTVACARCHDHKFDPIPTADYYSLCGILSSSETPGDSASPMMLADKQNPSDHPILIRGQIGNHGPVAPRQFLTALRRSDEPRFTDGSGRWELVERITAPDNPLTARVMVNRIWGHLIGKPLVDSPSDFGFRTEPPAVPEILDELAVEFAQHWSVKRIVRRIVLSRLYRQSCDTDGQVFHVDPDNRWLMRGNRRRRDFESLRDSVLQVSGSLDRSLGGKPFEITSVPMIGRKTVYARIDRQNLPALFRTFDFASPDTHSPERYYTTVPQQALYLMNNRQLQDLAGGSAGRIRLIAATDDPSVLVHTAFQQLLARNPTELESAAAIDFLMLPNAVVELPVEPSSVWSYGTSIVDDQDQPVGFTPFAIFKDNRWQAAETFPAEPPHGHASLTDRGGHTAVASNLGVVRRFTAPHTGTVHVVGKAAHRSDKGDGVRFSIWTGGQVHFQDTCQNREQNFEIAAFTVQQGQTVDLVACPGESNSHDSYELAALIELRRQDGSTQAFGTRRHFGGPADPTTNQPLDRLAQLAQSLMITNEFAFVD